MIKAWIAFAITTLAAGPALAGVCTTPGPEFGDGIPGLIVVLALVGGFFAVRQFRKQRA